MLLRAHATTTRASSATSRPSSRFSTIARASSAGEGVEQHPLSSALEELHAATERRARGVNVVLGLDSSEDAWRRLDRRVNAYPAQRSFTAIGSGGEGFEAAMVDAVASVVGHVAGAAVSQRRSARGAYVSVTIGPVLVRNSDEVVQVYARMRGDARVRYFL